MRVGAGIAPLFTERRAVITPQSERMVLLLARLFRSIRQPTKPDVQSSGSNKVE